MNKLTWETYEYLHTEKTSDWYWIVGIVTLSIAIIAIILNNIIFGIFIIVASLVLSLFASRKPDVVTVVLDSAGITFGKTRYPYSALESFWFESNDAHPRLLIKSRKMFMHYIVIHADNEDSDEIRQFMRQHLKEEELTEPLLEKVLIYLGF
jgi:hypothetical protein